MRRGFTSLASVLGALALAWARAADTPPAGASGNAAEDPIAAAKREFEKTKSDRASGGQPRSGLPRVDVPELTQPSLGPSPLTPGGQKKKQSNGPTEKRSANWLLEAMEKPAETRDSRGNRLASDTTSTSESARGAARDATIDLNGAAQSEMTEAGGRDRATSNARDDAKSRSAEESRRTEPAPNPLARFMGEWMTPQDYALLKPVVDALRPGEAPSATSIQGDAPSLVATPMEIPGESRLNTRMNLPSAASTENPYLQLLNTSPPSAAPVIATPAPVSNPVPVIVAPPSAPPEPAKSKIPDFAKPLDDQKLFKQLKRF